MNKHNRFVVFASLCLACTAFSCQDFFTSSWAQGLARDSYTIPSNLSVSEAMDLLAASEDDPRVAEALVPILTGAVEDETPGTPEYDEAANALVDAVLTSSEVSQAVFDAILLIPADWGSITPEQEDAIIDTLTSVDLSPAEVDALALVMANPPADGMSAESAYLAAMSLMSEAFAQVGVADEGNITQAEGTALEANAAYQLALQYLALGNTISGGTPTSLGGTLQGIVELIEDAVDGATP